jgi:hypothetical protein
MKLIRFHNDQSGPWARIFVLLVFIGAGCGNYFREQYLACAEGIIASTDRQEAYDPTERPTVAVLGNDVVRVRDSAFFSGDFHICSEDEMRISFDNDLDCKSETPAGHGTFGWINKRSGNLEVGKSRLNFHVVFVCRKAEKKIVD